MTKKQAVEMLKQIQLNNDIEIAHMAADEVLLELLRELGCVEVVKEFKKASKRFWYA